MQPTTVAEVISNEELRELALDLTQLCLDLAGIVDPTPISDGTSMLISLGRGRWFDAILSGVSVIPYVGDLAKFARTDRYLSTVIRAIELARQSPRMHILLAPTLLRLSHLMQLMPAELPYTFERMRRELLLFARNSHLAATVANVLPDISKRFVWIPRHRRGAFEVEGISGQLGIPGKVKTHRQKGAQTGISSGTGDHAGHRIGIQFGAPGDASNLALQNANINTYAPKGLQEAFQGHGGSYLEMESEWAEKLESGYRIDVLVEDLYRNGEMRPFTRHVEWTETPPNGLPTHRQLEFANTTSPQSRAAFVK